MPKYNYKCECGTTEVTHPIAECDDERECSLGHVMHRVPGMPDVYLWGPDFACNSGVARANVGRNPSNQNRYSTY